MDIYAWTIAISIVIYVAIGNYAGRGIKRMDDYYVAGRQAPTLIIVGTLVASLMSSTIFLGEVGFAYEGQAGPYVLFPQTACAGYVIGAILFGRYLRRSETSTVAEFFGQRFNSKRVQALAGYTIIFALGGYLLAVTQGAAILLSQITELGYTQALIVAWLSYTLFTLYSGSRGVILTDTLMFLVFAFASFFAVVYLVDNFGGVSAIVTELVSLEEKPGLMSWHGVIGENTYWPTAMDYLIWGMIIDISWLMVYAVSPWQSSRHMMAKNEHVVLRAAIIACVVVALLQVLVYSLGAIINVANPNIEPVESATIWASLNLLPAALGALMLAGITAAALSSASTFLSLVGFSASNDIGIRHRTDDEGGIRFTRIVMLAVGVIALGAALVFPPDIFWLMIFIGTIFASSWGPVAIMSIWSKRITEAGAFWGMTAGLAFNVVPKAIEFLGFISLPSYLEPALLGAVASLVTVLIVSRRTQVSETEASYLEKLHVTPESERDAHKTGWTLWAPVLLIANGIVMPFLIVNFYIRPYQAATGLLAPDGSINWLTGEVALASGWFLLYVSLGVFAIRVIRHSYAAPGNKKPAAVAAEA
ncbi:MAG: sodium:solute symporter family protein [Pseudomonadota bacterium]